jgi:DNA polymerase type B, organellar and viral
MARRNLELWVIDAETDPFKRGRDTPRPFIWGAYCKALNRYETFTHASLLVDFFRDRRACVYAHNGGRFDYHYLREWFESETPVLVINGRIAKFKIGKCEFRDSFSVLPVPLAAYQKEEIDYSIFEPEVRDRPENRERIERYLKSDCVNLAELLDKFFSRFGRPLTQAGSAMSYWVKNYRNGVKPRQSPSQFERYKPFYYGGRVECFAAGYNLEDFKVVDKNSAYPEAMTHEHPISPEAMLMSDLPNDLSRCFVCLNAVSRGALPWRDEHTKELFFPRDGVPRDYFVTGWELQAGLDLGLVDVRKIHQVHLFGETTNFRSYIEHFYGERQRARAEGDVAGDLFAKLFMNSCYGKFASDPSKYDEFIIATPQRVSDLAIEDQWAVFKPWGDGRFILRRPLPEQRHWYYNVATAASITGYVRAQLLRDLESTDGLLYCDTDSIAARSVSALTMGHKLGEWKTELVSDERAIAGKKMYAFRSAYDQGWNEKLQRFQYPRGSYKIACKGVDLTAEEIIRVARGECVHFEPEVPTYSITRPASVLISRDVRLTAKVQ